jgi:Holliday junction resolvasome RuvABC endonuclease subunit
MRRILAVDCGLSRANPTGVVVLDFEPEPRLVRNIELLLVGSMSWQEAVDGVGNMLALLVEQLQPDAIAYEMPHARINIQTALKLAHLGGTVRRVAAAVDIPCQDVQPAQAKKALTKNGAATKPQMMRSAKALLGKDLSKDEADAAGVALAGAALLGWFASCKYA